MRPKTIKVDDDMGALPVSVEDWCSLGDDWEVFICTWDDEDSHGPFLVFRKGEVWTVTGGDVVEVVTE